MKQFVRVNRVEQNKMSGAWYGWVEGINASGAPCSRPFKFQEKPTAAQVEATAIATLEAEAAAEAATEEGEATP